MQYQVRWKHIDKDLTKVSSWRGIRDLALVWIAVLAIAAIASRLASFDIQLSMLTRLNMVAPTVHFFQDQSRASS